MKKVFTFLILFTLVIAYANAQKNVVYATALRDGLAEGAWPENNDVIIQMLNTDGNFNVTVKILESDGIDTETGSPVDFSGYDVIILHDALGSGDNFWKEGYPGFIGDLPAPALYDKIYGLRAGRGLTTGDGASVNAEGIYNLTVVDAEHELFAGIDVSSGGFTAMKGGVSDDGSLGSRGLQYNTGNVLSAENTLLAYPEGITDAVISISDIPAGSSIDEVTLDNRTIVFGINVGVTRNTDYANKCALTVEGLTMWRNAIYSLAGLSVPPFLVDISFLPTSIDGVKVQKIAAYAVTGGIKIPADSNASIYSISGKIVAKGITSDFVSCPKGIYIVEIGGNASKVMVTR